MANVIKFCGPEEDSKNFEPAHPDNKDSYVKVWPHWFCKHALSAVGTYHVNHEIYRVSIQSCYKFNINAYL